MDKKIELGFIGLGKMGLNMCSRMLDHGSVNLHVYDINEEPMQTLAKGGAITHSSIDDLVQGLWQQRKVVWLMLPAGEITEKTFQEVLSNLKEDDIIIDGGNSNFHDTLRRHEEAKAKGIHMLDVGVSGGIVALQTGYPMMIGGEEETYEFCKSIFESFGYKNGYNIVGKGGAGHYVKMIHNAVEYGMMEAISEGFNLLKNGRIENLDLLKISDIWNHGCIVSSFLMQMTKQALEKDPQLGYLDPVVDDNGEGRWAIKEALEYRVPFTVNSYALFARQISKGEKEFDFKLTAAMRAEFGGHPIHKK